MMPSGLGSPEQFQLSAKEQRTYESAGIQKLVINKAAQRAEYRVNNRTYAITITPLDPNIDLDAVGELEWETVAKKIIAMAHTKEILHNEKFFKKGVTVTKGGFESHNRQIKRQKNRLIKHAHLKAGRNTIQPKDTTERWNELEDFFGTKKSKSKPAQDSHSIISLEPSRRVIEPLLPFPPLPRKPSIPMPPSIKDNLSEEDEPSAFEQLLDDRDEDELNDRPQSEPQQDKAPASSAEPPVEPESPTVDQPISEPSQDRLSVSSRERPITPDISVSEPKRKTQKAGEVDFSELSAAWNHSFPGLIEYGERRIYHFKSAELRRAMMALSDEKGLNFAKLILRLVERSEQMFGVQSGAFEGCDLSISEEDLMTCLDHCASDSFDFSKTLDVLSRKNLGIQGMVQVGSHFQLTRTLDFRGLSKYWNHILPCMVETNSKGQTIYHFKGPELKKTMMDSYNLDPSANIKALNFAKLILRLVERTEDHDAGAKKRQYNLSLSEKDLMTCLDRCASSDFDVQETLKALSPKERPFKKTSACSMIVGTVNQLFNKAVKECRSTRKARTEQVVPRPQVQASPQAAPAIQRAAGPTLGSRAKNCATTACKVTGSVIKNVAQWGWQCYTSRLRRAEEQYQQQAAAQVDEEEIQQPLRVEPINVEPARARSPESEQLIPLIPPVIVEPVIARSLDQQPLRQDKVEPVQSLVSFADLEVTQSQEALDSNKVSEIWKKRVPIACLIETRADGVMYHFNSQCLRNLVMSNYTQCVVYQQGARRSRRQKQLIPTKSPDIAYTEVLRIIDELPKRQPVRQPNDALIPVEFNITLTEEELRNIGESFKDLIGPFYPPRLPVQDLPKPKGASSDSQQPLLAESHVVAPISDLDALLDDALEPMPIVSNPQHQFVKRDETMDRLHHGMREIDGIPTPVLGKEKSVVERATDWAPTAGVFVGAAVFGYRYTTKKK